MKITLTDAGKRFNRDWIFRHISFTFHAGHSYAITGPNGSGKSTLLQVIGGAMLPSEGTLQWELSANSLQATEKGSPRAGNGQLSAENVYQYISIAAPYLELVEEMTTTEFLTFHQVFKPLLPGLSINEVIGLVGLKDAAHKQIRYYSSGMKQRVKLAQAIFSDTALLLLDEPCTNLDEEGIALYHELMSKYSTGRIVVVSSNDREEYTFCETVIDLRTFK